MRRQAAKMRGLRQIAQKLSSENSLKINTLYQHDSAVTGNMPNSAMSGAVVEFSARAGIGFADD